jgi:serine/threonine-protein kinase
VDATQPGRLAGAIVDEEPERPSAAVAQAAPDMGGSEPLDRLRRRLQGDLDNIVLMAIRKDPQRRYGSAEQFSDDIRRYLDGLPVIARRDTLGYRSSKFLRRHLAATAAVSAVLLALVGGLIVTIRAERAADRERIKAQRISDFVQKMLGGADPTWNSPFRGRGRDLRVTEVLDASADRLGAELHNEPEVEAELRSTLGNTYRGLGLLDAADKQLQIALGIQLPALGEKAQATARTLYFLGDTKFFQGRYADSERYFRRSLPGLRQSKDDNLPNAINDLANVMVVLNRGREAEPLYREALDLSNLQHRKNDVRRGILLSNLGSCTDSRGDIRGAIGYYRQALDVFLALPGDPPMETGVTFNNLARMERTLGHWKEAMSYAERGLAVFRKYLGDAHPYTFIGIAEHARIRSRLGDPKGAEQEAREALAAEKKALGDQHVDVARLQTTLGAILLDENDPRSAEPVLREALAIRRKALQAGNTRIGETATLLGKALALEGDYAAAKPLLEEGYQSLRAAQGESYPMTAEAREALAALSWKAASKAGR